MAMERLALCQSSLYTPQVMLNCLLEAPLTSGCVRLHFPRSLLMRSQLSKSVCIMRGRAHHLHIP